MSFNLPSGLRRSAILLGLGALTVTGCGSAAATHADVPASAGGGSTSRPATWASRASAICRDALGDSSHELVNHLDEQHVRAHGMAVVRAGSALDHLGPPPGSSSATYTKMLGLYMRSALLHGEAAKSLHAHDDGNAALYYSLALNMADRADSLAMGFGASSCDRFGFSQ
jgi:hypothetical protein